ncbi:MAG: SH3 domain-containing protein [Hyphomicrobiaceae bacterium]
MGIKTTLVNLAVFTLLASGSSSLPIGAVSAREATIVMRVVNVERNDVLNIREQPTRRSRILGVIPPNASGVAYLDQSDGKWLLVRYNDTAGWVHRRYVRPEVAGWSSQGGAGNGVIMMRVVNVPFNDVLNIREQATSNLRILGAIPPNVSGVEYLGQADRKWLLVRFNDTVGWVHRRYVRPEVAGWSQEAGEVSDSYGSGLRPGLQGGGGSSPSRHVGRYLCVLGSWRIHKNAASAYGVAVDRLPGDIDTAQLKLSQDIVPGRSGIWHRVIIDGFYSRSSARNVCAAMNFKPFSSFIQSNR